MNEGAVARAIEDWFRAQGRELPWRETGANGRRDPYRSLVSEFMLQQTQVSRVLGKFGPFVERFPDVRALASASEDDVLAMWSGLGYYSRARRLHAAARAIVAEHDGVTPSDVAALRGLPGVGRYTAGAIASVVFGEREALVDGNVQRVLVRLEGEAMALGVPATERWAWERAEALVAASGEPGVMNEGLMELGATVCTPRGPSCDACPVRAHCSAWATGRQEELPLPKPRAKRREVFHGLALVVDNGRILLERRPDAGLWAGMWSPPGVEREDRAPSATEVAERVGGRARATADDPAIAFTHETTHRIVRFEGFVVEAGAGDATGWFGWEEALGLALSNAHARLVRGARALCESSETAD